MANDDYHVLVYRVLSYLYDCLKRGVDPDMAELRKIPLLADVNERYWHYVLASLVDYGFIDGATKVEVDNTYARVVNLQQAQITPRGIEYLTDNSFMAKVKKFAKAAAEAAPAVLTQLPL